MRKTQFLRKIGTTEVPGGALSTFTGFKDIAGRLQEREANSFGIKAFGKLVS